MLKNPRQERFCLEYVATGNATQSAIKAGYSARTANNNAHEIMLSNVISARIAELRSETETAAVLTIIERKERLTELAKEELLGSKGFVMRYGNLQAIDILNKMDKAYTDMPSGYQDNRTINIFIQGGEEAKARLERIMSGKLTPKGEDDAIQRPREKKTSEQGLNEEEA